MVFLLLLLGIFAIAAGALGLGVGLPAKDTTFGAAAIVSASVAVTGGLILLGLAMAVAELRRVLRAAMRQMRQDRIETGGGGRGGPFDPKSGPRHEPRLAGPQTTTGNVADVIPARFDALAEDSRTAGEPPPAQRPRRAADIPGPRFADPPVAAPPPPEPDLNQPSSAPEPDRGREQRFLEPRFAKPVPPPPPRESGLAEPAAPAPPDPAIAERPDSAATGDQRNGGQAPHGEDEARPSAAGEGAARPVRVLKSGTISEVAYTLFSDGTIETKTADGTLHFSSIDEFRRHLENSA